MGLEEYYVNRDKFEYDERFGTLSFPCCVCVYRTKLDSEDPCRTCGHNLLSVDEDEVKNG